MRFTINRDSLVSPLQLVCGAVERRQTLPILSNVLLVLEGTTLSLTATDLEVELIAKVELAEAAEGGEITVPARKFLDICKSLPSQDIEFILNNQKVTIKCGSNKFTLVTLPASEFPAVDETVGTHELTLQQSMLKGMMDQTAFAMAQQDVRYYLNGMLFEITDKKLKAVATDGHRLALCDLETDFSPVSKTEAIIPRKGIQELMRLLGNDENDVKVTLGTNHLRVVTNVFTFTSKLIDGKFPEYDRVLPKNGDRVLIIDRETLKDSFSRASILCNEKYRGVKMNLSENLLSIHANNPEQEEAEIDLGVDFQGEDLEIGFNVTYLLDVLNTMKCEKVKWTLGDSNSSALIEDAADDGNSVYVVMPMRL
ncbi:MAG: DNA polymerase-3 subunit beta [Enterobacterales bacterium]|jgi:DNA polymerase-3 subunit beta